jgi:Uri superfamily endonuclease
MMALKGIYVLAISISKSKAIRIGALGKLSFSKGFYAYVGSAQNSLEKRLERHLRKEAKRRFWHIDHLLADECVTIVNAFVKEAEKSEECITAQVLGEYGFPIDGFGCSDCGCRSHLSMFSDYNALEKACLKLGFKPFRLSCQ